MKINIQMIREASKHYYCCKQIINFCKIHSLNINDLLNEGLEEELIIATNDSVAIQIVDEVKLWEAQKRKSL